MPHFHIEYSVNLEAVLDMGALCEAVRAAASELDTFPLPGIRVRATGVDHVAIADGDPRHGFIDMSVRLRAGRSDAVKAEAIAHVFGALKSFAAPALQTHSIALSAEMRDIDPALSPKFGTIRDHMKDAT